MLDKATLTLGDNRRVDLSQDRIFLTSNLGGGEITELMHGGMGFVQPTDMPSTGLDQKVERTAVEAARRKFSPEFMNRWIKSFAFTRLRENSCKGPGYRIGPGAAAVLETAKGQFLFRVTGPGKEFLLQEGTIKIWRAAPERAIERTSCILWRICWLRNKYTLAIWLH